MVLDKNAILAARKAVTKEVEVPEWAGKVLVRKPSALDLDLFIKAQNEGGVKGMIEYLSAVIVDEKGDRQFVTEEDKAALGSLSFTELSRVFGEAQEFGAPGEEDKDALKNSPATAGGSSS